MIIALFILAFFIISFFLAVLIGKSIALGTTYRELKPRVRAKFYK